MGGSKKMRLLPLIAATYFMVSGGPYGLEDIIGKAGYGRALLLLALVPLVWSLPTSLMVGELASALPQEGGYYCWVRRALGGFWGFQEAWLSMAASVFDMAIYPVIFVTYLGRLQPAWTAGARGRPRSPESRRGTTSGSGSGSPSWGWTSRMCMSSGWDPAPGERGSGVGCRVSHFIIMFLRKANPSRLF